MACLLPVGVATLTGNVWSILPRVAFSGSVISMVVVAIFLIAIIRRLWKSSQQNLDNW